VTSIGGADEHELSAIPREVSASPKTEHSDNSATDEEYDGASVSSRKAPTTGSTDEGLEEPPESEVEFWYSYEKKGVLRHKPNRTGQ
jgi:hypothetical protein